MNVIVLRGGCFGRKWLHASGLLSDDRRPYQCRLPHEYSRRHILGTYRTMRRNGLADFQARYAVWTLLASALDLSDLYGLVKS